MKTIRTFILSLLVVAAWGITLHAGEKMKSDMPPADAEKLYQYISKDMPYTSWKLWPGKGKLYQGREPHGSLLTTYINKTAGASLKSKKGMKDGSIIVKENYTADKKLAALTVMYKVKDFNPDAGNWFWVKYAPDGAVQATGKVDPCIKCHAQQKDNDYIFTGKIK